MAHFRVTDSCLSLWSRAQLPAAASPWPCWVPAPAFKALRATTGAVSPQPGQISPGRDCSTPSGVSDDAEGGHTLQWEMSKSSQTPWFEATHLPWSHSWMDSLLMLMFQHPKAQHRLPPAPAGTLQDWLLPALCHIHPVDADTWRIQGFSWPLAKRLWAGNPQLCSLLAIHRSPNSQCVFKVLGRLPPVYLKACLKLCLIRLSLKRTTLSFKSKFLSLWGTEIPGGLVWDWGMHIYKSKLLLQTSPPAVLSDMSVVLILLFFLMINT